MDEKRRSKRAKPIEEGTWECSVCTYKNSPEAFKCDMCDVRKGTSTRKPRINPQLVAQQVAQQFTVPVAKKEKSMLRRDKASTSTGHKHEFSLNHKRQRPPRLKNIDRSSGTSMEVTVGNVTVIITDYKPKKEKTCTDTHTNSCTQSDSADSNVSTSNSELTNGDADMTEYDFKDDDEA